MTGQNTALFAGAQYYSTQGVNALYYATYDPSTGVIAYQGDTSDPNINAVTAGDLNGEGLADVVGIDQFTMTASVFVHLAHSDGTITAGASTPAGTSTLTITANAGLTSHTATYALTVQ